MHVIHQADTKQEKTSLSSLKIEKTERGSRNFGGTIKNNFLLELVVHE